MAAKKKSSAKPRSPAAAKAKKIKAKPAVRAKPKAKVRASTKKGAPKKKVAAPKKKVAAPKKKVAAPKKKVAAPERQAAAKPNAAPPRRDATGHLTPKYARELRARSRENRDESTDRAFLRTSRSNDDLAEELGEEAVAAMTSGEDQSERLEAEVEEERGGPFVLTRGRDEYARGTDKSNPQSATREPFPKT